jgi:hypothetical protein
MPIKLTVECCGKALGYNKEFRKLRLNFNCPVHIHLDLTVAFIYIHAINVTDYHFTPNSHDVLLKTKYAEFVSMTTVNVLLSSLSWTDTAIIGL